MKIDFFKIIGLLSVIMMLASCLSDVEKADKLRLECKYDKAFLLYKKAADEGNAYAMWRLSNAYDTGRGVEFSMENSYNLLKKAAENGCEEAMIDLANWRICGQYNTIPDTIQGLKMISELEKNSKNSYVISRIAELYYIGVGELLKKDDNKAFELLQTVENKEEPQYLWLMGVFYSNGTEVIDIDGNKAISYFEKAFANGRIGARQLGVINYYGYANIEKNIDKAIEWYKKGVEIGSTSCMLQLVYIYISEDSILQKYHNEKEALSLVRKAIRLGSGTACDELGRWYSEGFIVEKDDVKAFENFVKADLYGSSNGSLNLGVCYIAGRGCEQDSKKAEQLWQKAANMGSQVAAMHLATSYLNGVLDNSSEKYVFYLEKAAKLGSPEAYYELATNYYYALHGYKKDVYQAFVYTKKAADEGLVDACETVASMYEEGVGCEKNLQKAREYRSKKYL